MCRCRGSAQDALKIINLQREGRGVRMWVFWNPPPPYNSKGFVGWAPATPSFLVYRSLVKLCASAPFRFVFMEAPFRNLFVVVGHLLVPLTLMGLKGSS